MLQIAIWGLAGLLAVVSTFPLFAVRIAGASFGAGKGMAWAVAMAGFACAAFLIYASIAQVSGFEASTPVGVYNPDGPTNPFTGEKAQ